MKDPFECTKEDFLEMDWFYSGDRFNGVIMVPTENLHDSGVISMKLILCDGNNIVGVTGGKDVIQMFFGGHADLLIDCLPKSGCIRAFCDHELKRRHDDPFAVILRSSLEVLVNRKDRPI